MREPYDEPLWTQWKSLLPRIHVQAERNSGFVWRYKGEEDGPGFIEHGPLIMGNLSAWTDEKSLREFTFGPGTHGGIMKHRSRWFKPWPEGTIYNVLWWGSEDWTTAPGILDMAKRNLKLIQQWGPKLDLGLKVWSN
jgi:hypothetical protein